LLPAAIFDTKSWQHLTLFQADAVHGAQKISSSLLLEKRWSRRRAGRIHELLAQFASASSLYAPFSGRGLCVDYEMSMCGLPVGGVNHLFGVYRIPAVRRFDRDRGIASRHSE